MRSKITFVLLFMLTFTVMHDTVINIIQKSDHLSIVHYMSNDVQAQECGDIHEVHSMFHFIGLIVPFKNTFLELQKQNTPSNDLLRYTLPYKETSYKPPIA